MACGSPRITSLWAWPAAAAFCALAVCYGEARRPSEKRSSQVEAPSDRDLPGFRAFVINLDSQRGRLQGFNAAVGKHQPWMASVMHRVAGIDGHRLLSNKTVIRDMLGRGVIGPKDLEGALKHEHGAYGWGDLSPGAVGLYLSHFKAWKEIVSKGLRFGLIFEDDLRFFASGFEPALRRILREEPKVDLAYFQHCLDSSAWPPGAESPETSAFSSSSYLGPTASYRSVAPDELVPCLAAYLLSNRGARRLLRIAFPISQQLDMAVSNASAWKGLRRIVFEPALAQVGPESYTSSVQDNSLCQKWGWKAVSMLGMWSRHLFYPWCAI